MQAHTYQPDRRAVLRAGTATLAAITAALCAAHPAGAASGHVESGQQPPLEREVPQAPGHRHLIGVL
ncbi:hypothetical protein [Arthrobacter sp. MAHUQ-56]